MGVWEYENEIHLLLSHANYIIRIQILSNTVVKCTQFTHIFENKTYRHSHTPILPYFP
jgi:hypothetical protein